MKNTAKRDKTAQSDEPEALPKPQNADPQQPDHITHITHMVPPNPNEIRTIRVNLDHIICSVQYKDFSVMRLSTGIVIKHPNQETKSWGRFQILEGEIIN